MVEAAEKDALTHSSVEMLAVAGGEQQTVVSVVFLQDAASKRMATEINLMVRNNMLC